MPIWAWILILIADFAISVGIGFLIGVKMIKVMLKRFNPFSDPAKVANMITRSTGKKPTKSKVKHLTKLLNRHKN